MLGRDQAGQVGGSESLAYVLLSVPTGWVWSLGKLACRQSEGHHTHGCQGLQFVALAVPL